MTLRLALASAIAASCFGFGCSSDGTSDDCGGERCDEGPELPEPFFSTDFFATDDASGTALGVNIVGEESPIEVIACRLSHTVDFHPGETQSTLGTFFFSESVQLHLESEGDSQGIRVEQRRTRLSSADVLAEPPVSWVERMLADPKLGPIEFEDSSALYDNNVLTLTQRVEIEDPRPVVGRDMLDTETIKLTISDDFKTIRRVEAVVMRQTEKLLGGFGEPTMVTNATCGEFAVDDSI